MIAVWIIDAVRRQEQEEAEKERLIPLEAPMPEYEQDDVLPEASPTPSDRGVVVIDL